MVRPDGLTAPAQHDGNRAGLPSAFAQLDIDKQLIEFKDRLQRLTGSDDLSQFTDARAVAQLTDTYLARSQIAQMQSTVSPAQTALILLDAGR